MGRVVIWTVVALAIGGLGWFLLGEGGDDGVASYGPLADFGDEGVEESGGPGLEGREGGALKTLEPETKGDAKIRGVVVDDVGVPQAGVVVTASKVPVRPKTIKSRNPMTSSALSIFEPPVGAGRVVSEATTASDGTFEIPDLQQATSYRIKAVVAAPKLSGETTASAVANPMWPTRLVITTGSAFRGKVVDAQGKGLQAYVRASSSTPLSAKPWLSSTWYPAAFQTGSDGRFTIDAVPNGTLSFFVVVPGRGSRTNIRIDTPAAGEVEIPFEIADGATLEGRVTDTKGVAIAGAQINVQSGPEGQSGDRALAARAATSAEDGTFSVAHLSPGVITSVNVHAKGYVPSGMLGNGMPLTKDKPTTLNITLARGATITGTVLGPDGAPVPGAEVAATRMGQGFGSWFAQLATTVSGPDGTFKLEDVALGSGLVQAKLAGYYMLPTDHGASNPYPWMQNTMQGTPYDASEEGQALSGKNVKMGKGLDLKGRVEDETAIGLGGATVVAARVQRGWSPGLANVGNVTAQTDADGNFTLPGLEPDKAYNLTATTDTHLMEKPTKLTMAADMSKVKEPTLVLKEGASVAGVVTEADGQPAPGVLIWVQAGSVKSAVTQADGSFEVLGIKAGKWTVQATGVNPVPETAKKQVEFTWSKRVEGIALSMPAIFSIRGIVEDEAGKPLAGVSVRAAKKGGRNSGRNRMIQAPGAPATYQQGGGNAHAMSNNKGAFEIRGLLDGEYTVYAGTAKAEGVSAGATDVRLTFSEPDKITIEGRVVDEQGQPVPRGQLRIWTGPTDKRRSQVQAPITAGFFRARVTTTESAVDLEVVNAYDAAGRPLNFVTKREKDVSLSGDIELRLDAGLSISGRVVDAGGRALAGMQVRITKKGSNNFNYWGNQQGGSGGQDRSGEDGSWTVRGLKDGDYTANLTPGGDWITPDPVAVRTGDTDIVIKLEKGLTIEGTVVDPDGQPLPGANVWMQETQASKKSRGAAKGNNTQNWMAGQRLRTVVKGNGRFVIKGLPPDAIFNVSGGGNGADMPYISETLNDIAAGTKTVELRLRSGVMIEGELVGPNGEAIRNGYIQATPVNKADGLKPGYGHLNGQTNKFKVGPLMPGRYKLTVQIHAGGYAAPASVEADAPSKGITLKAGKTTAMSGTLQGENVKGFYVMFGSGGTFQSGMVQADGSWKIQNVKSARGDLFASKKGDDRYGVLRDLEPGKGPFTVSLQIGEAIEGTIEGWDGTGRVPNIYTMVNGRWNQGTVNKDGTFRITGLAPGTYDIQGWMQGGQIERKTGVESGATGVVLKVK